MVVIISENLQTIKDMEKDYYIVKIIQLNMKEILLMVDLKEKESLLIKRVIIMLGNF